MAIKAISQFDAATPNGNDYILFEQNGEGKSAKFSDFSLTYEKIMASTNLSGKVASAITIKNIGINKIFIFNKEITDDSSLLVIEAGDSTYQGYPKFVSAFIVSPPQNADIGGFVWYQYGDETRIYLRHSKPSRSFGNPSVRVMVIV